ncbi:MAG: pyruvate kinase [Candidatus Shapirobacteria bacterium]|jgi:pyruvate kinase
MVNKTKIIATIGPASADQDGIDKLILAGANLFRFNLKHNTTEWHQKTINLVLERSRQIGKIVGIIVDIPKPEMATIIYNADFIALSYIRDAYEVEELRKILDEKGIGVKIIAKIENGDAIKNLSDIAEISDAIMIARGDLGVEVPIEQLAFWQKTIINWCRTKNKPVIVATQMLQSMVNNPTPTRAEATDVANAIFDGTDAIMLSEESAIGKYPVQSVEQMMKICMFCEGRMEMKKVVKLSKSPTEILIAAASMIVEKSEELPIRAVVVFSQSGNTVRELSSNRLKTPIVAITDNQEILQLLSLSFGVLPYYKKFENTEFRIEDPVFDELVGKGILTKGEAILVIHGNNWLSAGSTSDISLKTL